MNRLNPYAKVRRDNERKVEQDSKTNRASNLKTKQVARKKYRKQGRKFITNFRTQLAAANDYSEQDYKAYIKSIKIGEDAMKDKEQEEGEH